MVYTRNPTEVNAIQWKIDNLEEIKLFCENASTVYISDHTGSYTGLLIKLPDGGNQVAKPFDYIKEHVKGKNKFYTVVEKEQFEAEYSSIFQMTKLFILAEQRNILAKIKKLNDYITDPDPESPFNKMPATEQSILKSEKYALQTYLQELKSHQLLNWPDEETVEKDKSKVAVKLNPVENTRYTIKLVPAKDDQLGKVIVKDSYTEIVSVSSEKTSFANLLYTVGTLFGWDEDWYDPYVSDMWKELETDTEYDDVKEFKYHFLTKTIYNIQIITTESGVGKIRVIKDEDSSEVLVKELSSTDTFQILAEMVANELGWDLSWSDTIDAEWLNKPTNTAENKVTNTTYMC